MTEVASRLNAALSGRYLIERQLGEGGMATVYLAADLKHERKVAIKVLKPELAAVLGGERFLTEIRTTANLQHPHILPLFDSGEADGFLFYVMPYVEGESLRERLEREQQLGIDEAVRIARDVADALDYAHRKDIIHRDIKPANILLHDGRPMVADFGIALAVSAAGGGRLTETGLSLGTPHYMSPEQASADRDPTARSDVYSLGCVLYEMLAGQPPHTGPNAQSVLVRILTEDPRSVSDARRSVPAHVAAAVTKAIEKLPADRFESARAFREALEDPGFSHAGGTHATATPGVLPGPAAPSRLAWHRDPRVLASMVVAAGAVAWALLGRGPGGDVRIPTTRGLIDLGGMDVLPMNKVVVSPDGERLAVVVEEEGGAGRLYVRNADEEEFRALPGTEQARFASFSPDGEWIAYRQMGSEALMKAPVSGGAPVAVVPAGVVQGGPRDPHWGEDGRIVFTGGQGRGLYLVSGNGGTPTLVSDAELRSPCLLPGGRFIAAGTLDSKLVLFDLDADSVVPLGRPGLAPQYLDTGHLLWTDTNGQVWAAPFDVSSGALGDGVPLLGGVLVSRGLFARVSVSRNGTAVFGYGETTASSDMVATVDFQGTVTPLPLGSGPYGSPRWSPDGQRIAYEGTRPGADLTWQIFVQDVGLQTAPRQITFDGQSGAPVWSPDGTRIAFSAVTAETDNADLFVKTVGDDTPPHLLARLPGSQTPDDWPAEERLIFSTGQTDRTVRSATDLQLWWIDPTRESPEPVLYLDSEEWVWDGRVDPRGQYLLYASVAGRGSRRAALARRFPEAGQPTVIAEPPALHAAWSPTGDAVYYLTGDPAAGLGLVRVTLGRDPLRVLSRERIDLPGQLRWSDDWFDLHPDGDRIVAVLRSGDPAEAGSEVERHVLVVNWFDELRERLGNR